MTKEKGYIGDTAKIEKAIQKHTIEEVKPLEYKNEEENVYVYVKSDGKWFFVGGTPSTYADDVVDALKETYEDAMWHDKPNMENQLNRRVALEKTKTIGTKIATKAGEIGERITEGLGEAQSRYNQWEKSERQRIMNPPRQQTPATGLYKEWGLGERGYQQPTNQAPIQRERYSELNKYGRPIKPLRTPRMKPMRMPKPIRPQPASNYSRQYRRVNSNPPLFRPPMIRRRRR